VKQQHLQNIVVMGLGYIGLPTASMMATKGHQVLGVDINANTVETINRGDIHIVEPDLDLMVRSAVNSGNLKAALEPEAAETFILAVPTPFKINGKQEKVPDIQHVEAATLAICPFLQEKNLIILESTSPIGTTERVKEVVQKNRPELNEVYVAHCPERVLPGHILRELVDNDRIIGGVDERSSEKALELYKTFCNGEIYLTDSKTAEMAKLVENSYRDVNIAFANELSVICDEVGVNVWELIRLANHHPRVNILQPGPGVGGHCIAVDPWFIVDAAPKSANLIKTARLVNDAKPEWVFRKVRSRAEKFKKPIIGCLGLTFKANVDDLRESPALAITRALIREGLGNVMACDPNIGKDFEEFQMYSLPEVLNLADILVFLVGHDEFKSIDSELLKEKIIIDTTGICS